jgi:uncharacterized phiE125 gp8 family phage protein
MSKTSVLKTAPEDVPLTLAEAKAQLKLETEFVDDDALITTIIAGITQQAQDFVQRQFMQATWLLYLDSWDDLESNRPDFSKRLSGPWLKLPRNPVVSITSIKYIDTNGDQQNLDSSLYQEDTFSEPARIRFTGNLPTIADAVNAIVIEYVAGYGAADADVNAQQAAVPSKFKLWIKANIGTIYQNRQTIIAGRIENISEYILGLLSGDRLYL